jgi:protein-tyrosine phosphatase
MLLLVTAIDESTDRSDARPTVHILVVGATNLSRSAIAEYLLRDAATRAGVPVTVTSAGTHAVGGQMMHPYARRVLESKWLSVADWQSTKLGISLLESADLVLTTTAADRSAVNITYPPVLSRTFTLLEWARLAGALGRLEVDAGALRVVLPSRVAAARGSLQSAMAGDDIADPVGHRYSHFKRTANVIAKAVPTALSPFASGQSVRWHRLRRR